MKREGDLITLSMNESKDIIKNVTTMWDDVPNKDKYCCGFFSTFNLFKEMMEERNE